MGQPLPMASAFACGWAAAKFDLCQAACWAQTAGRGRALLTRRIISGGQGVIARQVQRGLVARRAVVGL